jgi:hypothetical protein
MRCAPEVFLCKEKNLSFLPLHSQRLRFERASHPQHKAYSALRTDTDSFDAIRTAIYPQTYRNA